MIHGIKNCCCRWPELGILVMKGSLDLRLRSTHEFTTLCGKRNIIAKPSQNHFEAWTSHRQIADKLQKTLFVTWFLNSLDIPTLVGGMFIWSKHLKVSNSMWGVRMYQNGCYFVFFSFLSGNVHFIFVLSFNFIFLTHCCVIFFPPSSSVLFLLEKFWHGQK